ncbi:hypothetical protein ABB37_08746 [Leptomonas pyrrhocoris]|uniref:Uncharacterized protein n=1 Tax=Leptomonas pyrrhocoris TaxID=157538 RepID=A0A0M9FSG9_LEPPY|nr:hypothetical protein ABB37_08746 [Leptomonas pyrrhocoris]KPA75067.1 hypothetical protein ABB37_08746 [Leptomonas pyrrhocoris]|eukprot:XP_015653506.1 hypothetical protein ABB37_08746 [Leptomonas pyrrhocoris]
MTTSRSPCFTPSPPQLLCFCWWWCRCLFSSPRFFFNIYGLKMTHYLECVLYCFFSFADLLVLFYLLVVSPVAAAFWLCFSSSVRLAAASALHHLGLALFRQYSLSPSILLVWYSPITSSSLLLLMVMVLM